MDKVAVGGLSFSLDRVGMSKGISLSAALSALSDETRQIIALVIDEAQHAITSEAGADALFALKAARDELNSSRHHGLRIVATGSNRDKLAMLRGSKDQAFFGAPLVAFPPLGTDYIDWFIAHLDFAKELDRDTVYDWFRQAAFRPEVLGAAVDALVYDLQTEPGRYAQHLEELVHEQIEANVWRAARGVYALEDTFLSELMDKAGLLFNAN